MDEGVVRRGTSGAERALLDIIIRVGTMLPVALSVLGIDGRSRWANQAYCDLVGLSLDQVMVRPVHEAVHPEDMVKYDRSLERSLREGQADVELRTLHGDGRWEQFAWALRHDPGTDLVFAIALNVTKERRVTRELRHEANHDSLTGAANRARIMRVLARWTGSATPVAVALIDLDGFKLVNDRMGHRVGDAVLRVLVQRLTDAAPDDAIIGRMGGDEFVVLLRGIAAQEVGLLASRLEAVSGPIDALDRRVQLSASIGVTSGTGADPEQLLHEADVAAYVAKGRGRGRVQVYDDTLRQRDARRRRVEQQLAAALAGDGLAVALQPIVRVSDRRIIGVEALARLPGEDTLLEAADFVDVAHGLGLMRRISHHVRDRALSDLRSLPGELSLYINLDSEDLFGTGGLQAVIDHAAGHGIAPDRLVLELTEATLLRHVDLAVDQLTAARSQGVAVAIDDFGAGPSSLSQVSRLPIDAVKVDRSFVVAARTDVAARVVLGAVAGIGPALDVDVVLEGVETDEDLALALDLGVLAVQGWLLGPPMPLTDLRSTLTGGDPPG